MLEHVGNKATEVTERVAQSAQSTFEQTKSRVAEQIRSVAGALEKATSHLKTEDHSGLADRAQRFTRKIEEASTYLQQKSARELTQDLDRLARQHPAWFLGTAFVLGLFGARFLKSSERKNGGTGGYRRLAEAASTGSSSYGRTPRPAGENKWKTTEVGYGTP